MAVSSAIGLHGTTCVGPVCLTSSVTNIYFQGRKMRSSRVEAVADNRDRCQSEQRIENNEAIKSDVSPFLPSFFLC